MTPPSPSWTPQQLDAARQQAEEIVRTNRLSEPLGRYSDILEACRDEFDELLEVTVDLTNLVGTPVHDLLTRRQRLEAIRYLAGPPFSEDDLKVVARLQSTSLRYLRAHPDKTRDMLQIVLDTFDRQRFPWLSERPGEEASQPERDAAVRASAILLATERFETARRADQRAQEDRLAACLQQRGFTLLPARTIRTWADLPQPGAFYRKAKIKSDQRDGAIGGPADFVIRLWDHSVMPAVCTNSNSSSNSFKRLVRETVPRTRDWRTILGDGGTRPATVLSGVYSLDNLLAAQANGVSVWWFHDLDAFLDHLDSTRPDATGT